MFGLLCPWEQDSSAVHRGFDIFLFFWDWFFITDSIYHSIKGYADHITVASKTKLSRPSPSHKEFVINPQKELSDIKANTFHVRRWPETSRERQRREGRGEGEGWGMGATDSVTAVQQAGVFSSTHLFVGIIHLKRDGGGGG